MIKLDHTRLLGFKLLGKTATSSKIGAKPPRLGAKIGSKVGVKVTART